MPKFKLSKTKVIEQYDKVKELCSVVSYSSKTNPLITPILEESTSCMFSIHMVNELKHVKDKSRVIFLAQAWSLNDIDNLISSGVHYFVVDNERDLDVLLKYLDQNSVKVNLFLRLKLKEHTLKTERYFVFGMTSEVVNKRLKELRSNDKIEKLGVHFHRKTQNLSEWNYEYELKDLIDLSLVDMVNIGGGLPADYANTNVDVINSIFNKIRKLKEFLGKELFIEPGRFIAAPSCKLETNIISVYDNTIVVDASVYNSDMDALIVPVKLLVEGEGSGNPYVIKGVTPCSLDLFRYRVYLENPRVGNKIVFLNAGAYNFSTDFCDLDKVKTE